MISKKFNFPCARLFAVFCHIGCDYSVYILAKDQLCKSFEPNKHRHKSRRAKKSQPLHTGFCTHTIRNANLHVCREWFASVRECRARVIHFSEKTSQRRMFNRRNHVAIRMQLVSLPEFLWKKLFYEVPELLPHEMLGPKQFAFEFVNEGVAYKGRNSADYRSLRLERNTQSRYHRQIARVRRDIALMPLGSRWHRLLLQSQDLL
jgi:hypothetical protein